MTEKQAPASGWYVDPRNKTQLRWWDGAQWLEHYAPMPAAPVSSMVEAAPLEAAAVNAPMDLQVKPVLQGQVTVTEPEQGESSFTEKAQEFLNNPLVQGGAVGAVGAALGGAGAVALKKNKHSSLIFLGGIIVFVLGVIMIFANLGSPPPQLSEKNASGTVVKLQEMKVGLSDFCIPTVEFEVAGDLYTHRPEDYDLCSWEEGDRVAVAYKLENGGIVARLGIAAKAQEPISYLPFAIVMTVVGFFVAAWAGFGLVLRTGSVVGGIVLFLKGFQTAARKDKE